MTFNHGLAHQGRALVPLESTTYLAFFALAFASYWLLPRQQNAVLLLASYAFYGWWDLRFLPFLPALTLATFGLGLAIDRTKSSPRVSASLFALGVVVSLVLLSLCAYLGPLELGTSVVVPKSNTWVAPLGMSILALQAVSHLLDARREKIATRSLFEHASFLAFFPCVLAGPLHPASEFVSQLRTPRRFRFEDLSAGGWLFFLGLFKKLFVANNLLSLAKHQAPATSMDVYLLALMVTIGLYADLSGYFDLARGSARMLGIHVPASFALPFFATNPIAFWERWNATVSRWFRVELDAVFRAWFSRVAGARFAIYLAVVVHMLLLGLWHRSSLHFLLWGVLWAVVIIVFGWLEPALTKLAERGGRFDRALGVIGGLFTFHLFALTLPYFPTQLRDGSSLSNHFELLKTAVIHVGYSYDSSRYGLSLLCMAGPLFAIDLGQAWTRSDNPVGGWKLLWRVLFYFALFVLLVVGAPMG